LLDIKLPPKMSSAHLNDKVVTKEDNNPKYSKTTIWKRLEFLGIPRKS